MSRFKLIVFACLGCMLLGIGTRASAQQPVSPYFFGMSMTGGEVGAEPWPVDSFSGIRLWDSGVPWSTLNPAPGVYDWRLLNIWLNHAKQNNVDVMYCFGRVPKWASSNPSDTSCANEPGSCDPPVDLNADGTGTDQDWKNFVKAITVHAQGRIHYWELWNEFPNPMRWHWPDGKGHGHATAQQLVRMAQDARQIIKKIDPTAVIVSQSGALRFTNDVPRWQAFMNAGGGNYVDVVAFHGYTQPNGNGLPQPEFLTGMVTGGPSGDGYPFGQQGFLGFLQGYYAQGQVPPVWDTEGSWAGNITGLTDPDERAGFAIRFTLLNLSAGVQRFFWYEWDSNFAGSLWQWSTRWDLVLPSATGNVKVMPGFGDGSFQTAVNHGAGSNPNAAAVGDFNNDQALDTVVANQGSNNVSVLLGNGNGTFKAGISSAAGSSPVSVAVGDFNKDGKLDVAVANAASSGTVSVLLGNGDGTFQSPVSYNVGSNPSSVAVGDFNNDGYPDIAVSNAGSGTVSVLLNNQHGGFGVSTYATGNNPSSVAVGDFNNDGYADLAVANMSDGTVSVLLNNTNGTFGTATAYGAHLSPSSVAAGNITVSGNLSLVVANEGSNDVSLLVGNGNGTFAAAVNYAVGSEPVSIAVEDFNGDGFADVVTADKGDNTVSTLIHCTGKKCNGSIFNPALITNVGGSPVNMAVGAFDVIGNNDPGTLLKAGIAYQTLYNWTTGNTISTPCSGPLPPNSGVWTCGLTGPNGYQAQLVWVLDPSNQNFYCSKNSCTTEAYTADPKYVQYRTAYGQVLPITGNSVQIGYLPLLLENQNPGHQVRKLVVKRRIRQRATK